MGSPASGWRCVLRHALSPGGCPSFSQAGPAPSHWVPLLWTWLVWETSTISFSYAFLRDVVTFWVNSVFLSLLIANEGLHWWLFLFRYSHPFWGRVVVFIRPHSVCRNFWWLVATLLPGLSLSFARGCLLLASSPMRELIGSVMVSSLPLPTFGTLSLPLYFRLPLTFLPSKGRFITTLGARWHDFFFFITLFRCFLLTLFRYFIQLFYYTSFPFFKGCRLEKGHIVPVLYSHS